jgi:hypothetical protein
VFLQNTAVYLPLSTASHPRRQYHSVPDIIMFSGETSQMNLCQAVNNALYTTLANDPTASK